MALVMTGVPEGLAHDGWWLEDRVDPDSGSGPTPARRGLLWPLVGLLVLADVLFWNQAGPGLSLAIFLFAVAVAAARPRRGWSLTGLILGLLPLVDRVQLLSLAFALAALLFYVLHAALSGETRAGVLGRALARFLVRAPGVAIGDGLTGARTLIGAVRAGGAAGRSFRALALPFGLGMVFAGLLTEANPVLQDWAGRVLWLGDPRAVIPRALFWGGLALVIWPVLALATDVSQHTPGAARRVPWLPRAGAGVVTARSVTTSLVVFNAMFTVQTGLDATYLWAGSALPQGMSAAEYAHRGAYPLVATALLAGAFALVSRPFAAERRWVRLLLLAWVAQNVALVISALYRLDLYVETYGLTYLRVHAAVWMAMVAVGLVLVLAQVARGMPNGWLVKWALALGIGVLYLCSFVNFAGLIADHNLTAARQGRLAAGLDHGYLCTLGPDAWGAVAKNRVAGSVIDCNLEHERPDWAWLSIDKPEIEGWRDWSFRSWRVLREGRRAYSGRG